MKFLVLILGLLLTALAWSQTYGSNEVREGQGYVPFSISGFTATPLRVVSGTNVKFTISVGPLLQDPTEPGQVSWWYAKEVTNMTLKIAGQDIDLVLPTTTNGARWAKEITFQSTKFDHDTVLPIELTVTAVFEKTNANQEVLDTRIKSNATTVQCRTFNDLLSWRTTVTVNNAPAIGPRDYPPVAEAGLSSVRPMFAEMNHLVSDSATMSKAQIMDGGSPRLKFATGVFGFTHGAMTFVQDSGTSSMYFNDYRTAVFLRPPDHPKMNFAIFYACLMYQAAGSWYMGHFNPPPSSIPVIEENRFFAGFDEVVFSRLKAGFEGPEIVVKDSELDDTLETDLSEHASRLVSQLATGKTIFESTENANLAFMPLTGVFDADVWTFSPLPMKVFGDQESTLNVVYGYTSVLQAEEAGDPIAESFTEWYVVRGQ